MNRIYLIFRDLLIAVFGGLVGAIFGLYGSGNVKGTPSMILIIIYGLITGVLILILDLIFNK